MLIKIYEASNTGFYTTLILPILLGLALMGLAFYLHKKEVAYENRNIKNLGFLMSLFGIVLCFGVALFSFINLQRIQPVELHAKQLKIEGDYLPFTDIKRVYLHQDFQASHISAQLIRDTTYILVVEERAGKTHLLSEENYPIKEMVVAINEQMER